MKYNKYKIYLLKNKVLFPLYIGIAATIGIGIGWFLNYPPKYYAYYNQEEQRQQKIRQIIDYIDYEYVDRVNTDSILDMTITNLLRRLDPHSAYIPLEDVTANEENIKGHFEGIGVEFRIYHDTLTVLRVIEDGPSYKAGLRPGDRILSANGEILFGESANTEKIISVLKGKAGTKVDASVYRPVENAMKRFTIKRGEVPLNSVVSAFMPTEDIGYLKLVRFSGTSKKEVDDALKQLKKQGARKIIIDLRDNPGGLLSAARAISDEFLKDDELIVFTQNREGEKKFIYASNKGIFEDGKVAVLINEGSASASEIVAGAIQDNDRGLIVGRRSFGKGLVQEEMRLNDGSRIRLTTQKYYTPTGRSIQKPYTDYSGDFLNAKGYDHNLPQQDTSLESREFVTPGGRVVYGGGGITPDVYVPFDTSQSAAIIYHLSLVADFDNKAFEYADRHRAGFNQYSKSRFLKEFEVTNEVLNFFFSESVRLNEIVKEETMTLIKARVKAYIGNILYGESAFIEAYYPFDPIMKEALTALQNDSTYMLK